MASPYRRDTTAARPERRVAPSTYVRPSRFAGFVVAAFKIVTASMGLAFTIGMAMGAYQTQRRTMDDASDIAAFVSQSVSRTLNTPAYLATGVFDFSHREAGVVVTVNAYLVMPYETAAFAGGYSGCMIVQTVQAFVPSWTFHF